MTDPSHSRSRPDEAELEAAAKWYLHIREHGAHLPLREADRLRRWLAASPLHVEAFAQVQRTMGLLETSAAGRELEDRNSHSPEPATCLRQRPLLRWAAAITAMLAVTTAMFWAARPEPDDQSYLASTSQGERKTLSLSDGSLLVLDGRTTIRVNFNDKVRHITLISGQARFDVAHDHRRPFVATAGGEAVMALGTQFNVDKAGDKVGIYLMKGRVAVAKADPQVVDDDPQTVLEHAPLFLSPGNYLSVYKGKAAQLRRDVHPHEVLAWQRGQLLLNDERLDDAIAKMDRYSALPLQIDDDRVKEMRLSGVFSTKSSEGFVESVAELLPVNVRWEGRRAHLTCRNPERCD